MDYLQYIKNVVKDALRKSVLNLIINGLPSILNGYIMKSNAQDGVLNLIINGLPSIRKISLSVISTISSFKPYYKWITFNTLRSSTCPPVWYGFKPYYKWITFNTITQLATKGAKKGFKPYYKWITFNTHYSSIS